LEQEEDVLRRFTQGLGQFIGGAWFVREEFEKDPVPQAEIKESLVPEGGVQTLDLLSNGAGGWTASPFEDNKGHRASMDREGLNPKQVSAEKG
jgi:hypothetical protein